MKRLQVYKYRVHLEYFQSSTNKSITIPYDHISYIGIDKDFENTNMPVVALVMSIDKNLLDDMIIYQDTNYLTLNVTKYDSNNQKDGVGTSYISQRFIYITSDNNINPNKNIEYKEDGTPVTTNEVLKDITIFLMPKDIITNSRQIINGIFHNTTTTSMALLPTNYIGKMLIEPIQYDKKYDQIIIPPQDSISSYLEYLNSMSVFYDTNYRFFMDFDTTYLLSSSGKITKSKLQNIYTININILPVSYTDPQNNDSVGMIIDTTTNKAELRVLSNCVEYVRNNITNKLVNEVVTINSNGEVINKIIDDNKAKNLGVIKNTVVLSSDDNNAINNITSNITNNKTVITIMLQGLDGSQFTMNKEYIINDFTYKDMNGRYLIIQNKQLFVKQDELFTLMTVLTFKKI